MIHNLSFDVGTTSMKCILFNEKFEEVFFCEKEYSLITSDDNMVEMKPSVYYQTLCDCIKKMLESGIDRKLISSITITTQGETLIPIDKNGNPLRNAIVWLDNRASKEADFINSNIEIDEIYKITGLGEINGSTPVSKVLWIRNNEKELYDKTYKFMLLEDYLVFKLTKKAVTEQSLASSTAWFDIQKECYYTKILDICSIDIEKLLDLIACGEIIGTISSEAEKETGLSQCTKVVSGAMDQISSAIGAGNIHSGIVTETTGTALVVGATVENPDFNNLSKITIYKHFNHKFMYMPYCNTAGIVLKWFRDVLFVQIKKEAEKRKISEYALIDEIAMTAPAGSNGIVVLPHFAGKNGCEKAKGVIYGLTLGTKINEIARSVLESVGCMLRELIESIEMIGGNVDEIRSMGGGANSALWCEIKAGICNKNIICTSYSQTTALGAAILGAVAVGAYSSVEEAINIAYVKKNIYVPQKNDMSEYEKTYQKYSELYKALNNIF